MRNPDVVKLGLDHRTLALRHNCCTLSSDGVAGRSFGTPLSSFSSEQGSLASASGSRGRPASAAAYSASPPLTHMLPQRGSPGSHTVCAGDAVQRAALRPPEPSCGAQNGRARASRFAAGRTCEGIRRRLQGRAPGPEEADPRRSPARVEMMQSTKDRPAIIFPSHPSWALAGVELRFAFS